MQKEKLAQFWKDAGIADGKLIKAFGRVPREEFVLDELKEEAYTDLPLPILRGKTISQPTTIAIMTQALELKEGHKVLEIGTGSGYQAALIGAVVGSSGKVMSLEVVPELVAFARKNLRKAGISNVEVIEEDGSQGYAKEAPYDRIIATAACPKVPDALLGQLKDGGILVAPVGDIYSQEVLRIRRTREGTISESLGEFRFLPMVGKHGFKEEELEQF
ncbi:protein-L-isoaspartate(D-aspartate) O-methyltransferase [Candidatus Woesearchaeota archaeon]|nr:protein-L-isoaspartate(D-aspartate) O-methyltransferase [Candidatus Woesearchaeota archaeon]